jgi:hypothetical protein
MRDPAQYSGHGPSVENPYRPYVPYGPEGGPNGSAPRGSGSSSPGRRHGIAAFHDGNLGHYWRGEVFTLLGDAVLIVGLLLWIGSLTLSPQAVALVVALLALPWLLAGPLAAPLQHVSRPARWLRRVGQARVLCALGLVVMQLIHYRGIFPDALYPVLFLLIFANALCGRLRAGLVAAAIRTCLAPGDLEAAANDLQIGAALVAVVGPLLATLLFLALGERILLIAIVAAVIYFVAANSDGLLEPQPWWRRASALVTLELAVEDERLRAELLTAALPEQRLPGVALGAELVPEELALQAERALPEWYQVGPRSIFQGVAELRAGIGLAGLANSSRTSLYVLGALALVGGGLTVLEVFYVMYALQAPLFYFGPLLAAEAGGLALGGSLAVRMVANGSWRTAIVLGLIGCGLALAVWGVQPILLLALPVALLLGTANALAVMGARHGVRIGFDGPQRRALTAAENWLTALCAIAGAGIFVYLYLYLSPTYISVQGLVQNAILARFNLDPNYPNWSLGELFVATGLVLVVLAVPFGLSLVAGGVGPHRAQSPLVAQRVLGAVLAGSSMAFPAVGGLDDGDGWDDEDAYMPRSDGGYDRGYDRGYESASLDAYGYRDDGDDGRW